MFLERVSRKNTGRLVEVGKLVFSFKIFREICFIIILKNEPACQGGISHLNLEFIKYVQ